MKSGTFKFQRAQRKKEDARRAFYVTLDLIGCRHTFIFVHINHGDGDDSKKRRELVSDFARASSV